MSPYCSILLRLSLVALLSASATLSTRKGRITLTDLEDAMAEEQAEAQDRADIDRMDKELDYLFTGDESRLDMEDEVFDHRRPEGRPPARLSEVNLGDVLNIGKERKEGHHVKGIDDPEYLVPLTEEAEAEVAAETRSDHNQEQAQPEVRRDVFLGNAAVPAMWPPLDPGHASAENRRDFLNAGRAEAKNRNDARYEAKAEAENRRYGLHAGRAEAEKRNDARHEAVAEQAQAENRRDVLHEAESERAEAEDRKDALHKEAEAEERRDIIYDYEQADAEDRKDALEAAQAEEAAAGQDENAAAENRKDSLEDFRAIIRKDHPDMAAQSSVWKSINGMDNSTILYRLSPWVLFGMGFIFYLVWRKMEKRGALRRRNGGGDGPEYRPLLLTDHQD